jgi:hypothetical protein
MTDQNTLKLGDHNAICDVCGFKYKASDLRKRWDNLYVCKDDFELRHPMDFFKGRPDNQTVPWARLDSDADTNTTSVDGTAIQSDCTPEVYGDEDGAYAYSPLTSTLIEYSATLTVNRTLTINAGTEVATDRITVSRTAGGAFTLDIGGVYTIPASLTMNVILEYNGSAWTLVDAYTLGL